MKLKNIVIVVKDIKLQTILQRAVRSGCHS